MRTAYDGDTSEPIEDIRRDVQEMTETLADYGLGETLAELFRVNQLAHAQLDKSIQELLQQLEDGGHDKEWQEDNIEVVYVAPFREGDCLIIRAGLRYIGDEFKDLFGNELFASRDVRINMVNYES